MKFDNMQQILIKLIKTFLTLFKVLILSDFRASKDIKYHKQIRNCIILGNGPSLNQSISENKNNLQKFDLLSVNFFSDTDFYTQLRPKFHIIVAPELWKDDVTDFFIKWGKNLFQNIADKTNWDLILLMPAKAKKYNKWKDIIKNNKNISVRYFNYTPVEGFSSINHFFFRKNLGMPRPHNVLIPSILLMLNWGYENLYLFGADHSWLKEISVDENNRVLINQKHFYDEKTSSAQPMHKKGKGERRLHEILQKFYYSFSNYFVLQKYGLTLHAKIYNATPGSFIDAFERVKQLK